MAYQKKVACPTCGVKKYPVDFPPKQDIYNTYLGREAVCRDCTDGIVRGTQADARHIKLTCEICGETKYARHFPASYGNGSQHIGRKGYCRKCQRASTVNEERDKRYRYAYGITLDDVERMQSEQDGRCALCQNEASKLVVDHNHKTGHVRGLLCFSCNALLGLAHDDVTLLGFAIEYLKKERAENEF